MHIWSYREIHAKPYPRQFADDFEFENFMEKFAESFWEDSIFAFIMQKITISTKGFDIQLGFWPWWMPRKLILWYVSNKLAEHGFGGDIYFVTGKTVAND